jgi:hypothetical protein
MGMLIFSSSGCSKCDIRNQSQLEGYPIATDVFTTRQKTVVPDPTPSATILLDEVSKYNQYGYGTWKDGQGIDDGKRTDMLGRFPPFLKYGRRVFLGVTGPENLGPSRPFSSVFREETNGAPPGFIGHLGLARQIGYPLLGKNLRTHKPLDLRMIPKPNQSDKIQGVKVFQGLIHQEALFCTTFFMPWPQWGQNL